jgi:hypothetical protein
MKDIIKTFKEVYQEDRKEFWETILGTIFIMGFMIFVYWFTGTFMYDM